MDFHSKGDSDMRVIAGSAKRIQLKTPDGMKTRPTTDRIKETLFNMLQSELCDCDFLDLFSGSGAIGIEALSRGAKEAVFIEQNDKAITCIKENLQNTGLKKNAQVYKADVFSGLRQLETKKNIFDIVFMDPPYRQELEKKVLMQLSNSVIIDTNTRIIFEASLDTDVSYIEDLGYEIEKIKKYKTNMHVFLHLCDDV